MNLICTFSTGREDALHPCSSRKVGNLPRNSFKLTGVLMQQPPPVTVEHLLRKGPHPALRSSSSLTRYGVSGRSDGKTGKIDHRTSCLIVMVSLHTRGDFKPFLKRSASLSLHSSARTGSTILLSNTVMSPSAKCSVGFQVFSAEE